MILEQLRMSDSTFQTVKNLTATGFNYFVKVYRKNDFNFF